MRKILSFFLPLYFIFSIAHAQKLPNTLLWKISGNGLQEPSYLYGTFHMTDEKLFNLGDSLYKAIENSKGFAIEVNPDDMMPFLVDMVKKEINNSRSIKEMLGEKEYKKYSSSLSKKLHKPADDITAQDIFKEKNKWMQESFQKGKMSTFLDAYLFDIARRQGKWVGGVEDMQDQTNLLDNIIDESDVKEIALNADNEKSTSGLDKMMSIYLKADLNGIDSMMNFSDSAYRDALLVKRNKKMAMRMDSLSRVRTMVFAVGAAHLPGMQGLISLLRNKGFTVEPVFYSKKIKPDDYVVKEVDIPWINVDDPSGYYTSKMPGKPGDIEMYGMLDMKMYFDIFKSTGFLVTSINYPYDKKGIDSAMKVFAKNVFKETKLDEAKNITINGITGKEIEKKDPEGYKHGYILRKDNIIYIAVGFAKNNDAKGEKEVTKFLTSYQPHKIEISDADKPYLFTDSVFSYSVELPGEPKSGNDLANLKKDKTMVSNLMVSVDQKSGSYLLFGVNSAASGYSFINDSVTLASIRDGLKNKFSTVTTDTVYLKNNHRILEYNGLAKNLNINMRAYYEFRGNRWYALVAMYDSSKTNTSVERFFKSFKLLKFPDIQWEQKISEDSLLTVWSPAPLKYIEITDSGETTPTIMYRTYDSTRSDTYAIVVEALGKYYWKKNDSTFWNRILKNSVIYKDTLLSRKNVMNGTVNGIEIQLKEKGSQNVKRKEMFLFGDTLYTLSTTQQAENINDSNVNKFFENFRFRKTAPATTIYTSKASLLLNDLSNNDSAIRKEAGDALKNADFTVAVLPLLHEALLKKYRSSDYYKNYNDLIGDEIINLKDSSSLLFAKNNYLKTTDTSIKSILLDIISEYKTKENYDSLTSMLLKSPPLQEPSYTFLNNIKDSTTLAASMFPSILPLLKDTVTGTFVVSIAADLLDSNQLSFSVFEKYQQNILQLALWRYKKLKQDDVNYYSYGDDGIINLLERFNNAASNAMLQKWMTLDKNYTLIKCIKALAVNKQIINPKPLLKLAKDKSYRVDLFKDLKKIKRLDLFPKQYFTQQSIAESIAYNAATDDDDEPTEISFVTQKIYLFKGKKSRFFFFKTAMGEEDKTYNLVCAGPFDADMLKVSADKATGELYYKENYDSAHLKEQMDLLVKSMETTDD